MKRIYGKTEELYVFNCWRLSEDIVSKLEKQNWLVFFKFQPISILSILGRKQLTTIQVR